MELDYLYEAKVKRVVDGDTVELAVDLGFHVTVTDRFRLARLDTPEITARHKRPEEYRRGKLASKFTSMWIVVASEDTVFVRTRKEGKYGRYVAEIFNSNGDNLNDALIEWMGLMEEAGWPDEGVEYELS